MCLNSFLLIAALLPVIPQPREWHAGESIAVKISELGEEGYSIRFADGTPEIVAGGRRGEIWARRTLDQLKKSGELPRSGTIVDKPKYRWRGFMLDVGRMYHPMAELYRIAESMSEYKLNVFHIHLSDNVGWDKKREPVCDWSKHYAAFRMESEKFPGLTAKDGSYTKREFREFMLYCRDKLGITVVPEFDVPAHSLAFTRFKPEFASKKYGEDHLDLDKQDEFFAFFNELLGEYLTGENPVFIGPYMHIGTDEYDKREVEKFRSFTDRAFALVQSFGYKPCAWGALTHADGKTPVRASKDIVMHIWYNPYYDPKAALEAGYSIVSIPDRWVYIVPHAGYYRDSLNCGFLYEYWEPFRVADYGVPDKYLDQLLGGEFALWNDMNGKGYTTQDNFERFYPAMQVLSQKMWSGSRWEEDWPVFKAYAERLRPKDLPKEIGF